MEQEIMQNNSSEDSIVKHVITLVKRNFLLIVAIVFVATVFGVWYSYQKKPTYTATTNISFVAVHTDADNTKQNINTMKAYFATVVDFCDEIVVIDRANFYYYDYVENYQELEEYSGLEGLVKYLNKANKSTRLAAYDIAKNDADIVKLYLDKNLSKGAMSLSAETSSTASTFEPYIQVSYSDANKNYAMMKDLIVVTAANDEINVSNADGDDYMYFAGMKVTLSELSKHPTVSSNVSKRKIVVYAAIIGAVVAAAVVVVKTLLDNTVKRKEDLLEITDAPLLASITKWEESNNG